MQQKRQYSETCLLHPPPLVWITPQAHGLGLFFALPKPPKPRILEGFPESRAAIFSVYEEAQIALGRVLARTDNF
jgi:hypothetical protein